MARLVIGELGHAMPVASLSPIEHTTTEMAADPACAEHESVAMAPHGDTSESDHVSTHSGGEHDCCKSGDCECPCLHVPCVALDAAVMNPVSITLLGIPQGPDTVTSLRPSGLFRPPA